MQHDTSYNPHIQPTMYEPNTVQPSYMGSEPALQQTSYNYPIDVKADSQPTQQVAAQPPAPGATTTTTTVTTATYNTSSQPAHADDKAITILSVIIGIVTGLLMLFEAIYFIVGLVILIVWGTNGWLNLGSQWVGSYVVTIIHMVSCLAFIAVCVVGILSVIRKFQPATQIKLGVAFILGLVFFTLAQVAINIVFIVLGALGGGYGWSISLSLLFPIVLVVTSAIRIVLLHRSSKTNDL